MEAASVLAYPKQIVGLALTAVDDGFIIHDAEKDRVHYLNPTAALILILCDGSNAAEEIALLLQWQFKLPQAPEWKVAAILAQFADEGLVVAASTETPEMSPDFPDTSAFS